MALRLVLVALSAMALPCATISPSMKKVFHKFAETAGQTIAEQAIEKLRLLRDAFQVAAPEKKVMLMIHGVGEPKAKLWDPKKDELNSTLASLGMDARQVDMSASLRDGSTEFQVIVKSAADVANIMQHLSPDEEFLKIKVDIVDAGGKDEVMQRCMKSGLVKDSGCISSSSTATWSSTHPAAAHTATATLAGGLVRFPGQVMSLNTTTLAYLEKLDGPFITLVVAGDGRSGKSYLASVMAGMLDLFQSDDTARPVTEGLDIAAIWTGSFYLLVIDAEGGDNALAEFHAVVNIMGLALGQVLVWVTRDGISEATITALGQMLAVTSLIKPDPAFDSHQQELIVVPNKCTLRMTADDLEYTLNAFGVDPARGETRAIIKRQFSEARRQLIAVPMAESPGFDEAVSGLKSRVFEKLKLMRPLSLGSYRLDGRGVADLITRIFASVRDAGNVSMPSIVQSVILDGFLMPAAAAHLQNFTNNLPKFNEADQCLDGEALSAVDQRARVLDEFSQIAVDKVEDHANFVLEARTWLAEQLSRVWTDMQSKNTLHAERARASLNTMVQDLIARFEQAAPDSKNYIADLTRLDSRREALHEYNSGAQSFMSCLGANISTFRDQLSRGLDFAWQALSEHNAAVGREVLKAEQETRTAYVEEKTCLCGCRRRRRFYVKKTVYLKQQRTVYTNKDGSTSKGEYDSGEPVYEGGCPSDKPEIC